MKRAAVLKQIDASGEPPLVREMAARLVDDARLMNIFGGKDEADDQATLKHTQAMLEAAKDLWPEATLGDIVRAVDLLDAATAFIGK